MACRSFDFESVPPADLELLVDVEFVNDPLLPPPSAFMPPGFFREPRFDSRVPCYMLADYFVARPTALPPSAYYPDD